MELRRALVFVYYAVTELCLALALGGTFAEYSAALLVDVWKKGGPSAFPATLVIGAVGALLIAQAPRLAALVVTQINEQPTQK